MEFNFITWNDVLIYMIDNRITEFNCDEFEYRLNYKRKTLMVSNPEIMSITFRNQKFINIHQRKLVNVLLKLS